LDGYCRELIRAAPRYLNEGGFLQITLEWVQVKGESWRDRLAEWLADTGCDAWVLRSYTRSAAAYAAERIGRMMPYSPLTENQRFDEWMAYYRARAWRRCRGESWPCAAGPAVTGSASRRWPAWTARSRLATQWSSYSRTRTGWNRSVRRTG
jgi:hypothetical protein